MRLPLALLASAGCAVAAPAAAAAAPATITRAGAGPVKLGMTYTALRAQRLVGLIRPGCELGGPNTRSAPLRAPLRGSVDFTLTRPRKVANITVTGGATARGVAVGDPKAAIRRAYPTAVLRADATFQATFAKVGRRGGGPLMFFVPDATGNVSAIGIPFVAVCE